MKSFLAVTATLAAIALCAGESAAQTSMITPSSARRRRSGTGPGGFAANAQGAVLPYSETPSPAPCTTGNPATTMLPTFDGGGFDPVRGRDDERPAARRVRRQWHASPLPVRQHVGDHGNFVQGQTVKKGDVLAQIDPAPCQAQLDQAIANRDRDQAHLENARIDLNRYTDLAKQKSVAQQLADSQKAIVAQLVAVVKSDEAIIQSAKVNLGYTNLTSPIDGVTGIRQIDIGNIIHPTDVNGLVDVTQIEPISLIFTLPETDFARVQERMAQGPLAVIVDDQNGQQLDQGTLNLIDNQIIQTTGTIRLRAEFPNQKHRLWPGQLVNVRLLLDTQHNALTVKSSAVQQGPKGPYVYVVDSDKTVHMQPVRVGQIDSGQALIDEGLAADQEVVVAGQYKLVPGAHVIELHGKAAEQVQQCAVEQQVP